jgi:hypothetical protein
MASSNLDQNAHFGGHPSKKGLARPRPLMEAVKGAVNFNRQQS